MGIVLFLFSFCGRNEKQMSKIRLGKVTDSLISVYAVKNKKVDSLRKRLDNVSSDTAGINILLSIGRISNAPQILTEVMSQAKQIQFDEAYYQAAVAKQFLFAHREEPDSMEHYYKLIYKWAASKNRNDIIVSALLNKSVALESVKNFKSSDSIIFKAMDFMREHKLRDTSKMALAFYYLGRNKCLVFDNVGALNYLNQAAKYAEPSKDYYLANDIYFRIGECYLMESDFNNALKAYGHSVEYCKKINDDATLSSNLGAIGEIYMQKEDYKKAYENLFESLNLAKEISYSYQEAYTASTLGSLFQLDSNFTEALKYYEESKRLYSLFNKESHSSELLLSDLNIGTVYISMGRYDEGLECLMKVYKVVDKDADPAIAAELLNSLGEVCYLKNELVRAEQYVETSLEIGKKVEIIGTVQASYGLLYKIYEKKKDFQKAFLYHKAYTHMVDSATNKAQIKRFAELENEVKQNQLKAEYDKAETVLRNEKLMKEDELKRQRITSLIIGIGFVILLIGAVFIYRSLRENKKKTKIISEQKKEVEKQKHIIEEREKEVKDSITYAKRIQDAILPSDKNIKELFKDTFIFYKPKDIVAGDFYWLADTKEIILIAVADCTGHGVPGAMVSVVCSNALNRAVKEFGLTDPGLVLDKTREIVIETFEKSGSEVKDGMDISLLAVPKIQNSDSINLKWAGANNPLWYCKDGRILEIKGNKQPVGKFIKQTEFTTQTLTLKKNDVIYLITDGFADQFGGAKGKKFKYKQLIQTLSSISDKPMSYQKETLHEIFENWRGDLEQVDDVTVVGINL